MEIILGIILAVLVSLGGVYLYRRQRDYIRSLNMAFLRLRVPIHESKDDMEREERSLSSSKSFQEVLAKMNQFFESVQGIYSPYFKSHFIGQEFLSFEIVVENGLVDFYVVCPYTLVNLMEKQITSFYDDVFIEKVPDYNIFQQNSKVAGAYLRLSKHYMFPIKTYERMKSDPMNNILNALSKFSNEEGAAIQFMIRPIKDGWQKKGRSIAQNIFANKKSAGGIFKFFAVFGKIFDLAWRGAQEDNIGDKPDKPGDRTTPLTDEQVKAIEEKNTKPGFDVIIRLITSGSTQIQADNSLSIIKNAFAAFNTTDNNSFYSTRWHSKRRFLTNFIFRHFRKPWSLNFFKKMILCTEELASMYHVPSVRYNRTYSINWQKFKIAPAPANIPTEGILLGHNVYRGISKEIRIKADDRFRHFYVIGQTGTGKSSIMQVMMRQDLQKGNGFAVVDPHGQLIEDILPFIPKERADDVIYFNPADLERPLGLNMLEAETPEEREMVALDAMNVMIKLFNEEIFGPRIQDYFRNGCLTLMEDPQGGAMTDIVRLFTDDEFQQGKVAHVKNPIVKSFWEHQMAKTGAREKQEMIPYFAAKFGQFVTNSMMRNIIGQTKSAFDFNKVMQEGKILLMNLSKGETGDINSKLLGLIIVQKIQMAALRRQRLPKEERRDFFLYIDEFQNYITDSIEQILSEARKYRLGLVMAHQFIKQLEGADGKSKVKDAVFGNVGTMMCYKIGAQDAEFMAKEMAPVFSEYDLINLDKFKGVMKLSVDTQPSKPFSITPLNPYADKGDAAIANAIKQLSRLKYGRDREFVDREILRRVGAVFE